MQQSVGHSQAIRLCHLNIQLVVDRNAVVSYWLKIFGVASAG
jgi:hypothetical protein